MLHVNPEGDECGISRCRNTGAVEVVTRYQIFDILKRCQRLFLYPDSFQALLATDGRRDVLTQIFAERSTALMAHYKTLDQALVSDDRELIIASLKGISSIVSQNPLESFAEFTKALDNDDEVLNLDF